MTAILTTLQGSFPARRHATSSTFLRPAASPQDTLASQTRGGPCECGRRLGPMLSALHDAQHHMIDEQDVLAGLHDKVELRVSLNAVRRGEIDLGVELL